MKYLGLTILPCLLLAAGCGSGRDSQASTVPATATAAVPSNPVQPVTPDPKVVIPPSAPPTVVAKPKAKKVPAYEDPIRIQAGLGYDEMVRRFGPPSIKVTEHSGISTLSYSRHPKLVQVEVENGKVISVMATKSE